MHVLNKKYFRFGPDLNFLCEFAICLHLVLISYFMFAICDSILKRKHFPTARPAWIRSRFLICFATRPDSHFLFNNFLFKTFGVHIYVPRMHAYTEFITRRSVSERPRPREATDDDHRHRDSCRRDTSADWVTNYILLQLAQVDGTQRLSGAASP